MHESVDKQLRTRFGILSLIGVGGGTGSPNGDTLLTERYVCARGRGIGRMTLLRWGVGVFGLPRKPSVIYGLAAAVRCVQLAGFICSVGSPRSDRNWTDNNLPFIFWC